MQQVILDCDPGHDDAVAILLATRHLNVLGITTVSGNQSLEKVTGNALKVLELAGLSRIPVVPGCARPLVEKVRHASVHGESGLDGAELPEPERRPEPGHAVDFIIDTVASQPGVMLIATGPLTNVASALLREPRLAKDLAGISLMGGSLTYGNSTPAAEFNIWCDPEAAHVVFTCGAPIKMSGLNLTHQAVVGAEELARLRDSGRRTAQTMVALLEFHCEQSGKLFGVWGAPMHDACAVAWLVDDALICGRALHVSVELRGEHIRGMTVCDYRHLFDVGGGAQVEGARQGLPPNAEVGLRLERSRFMELLIGTLNEYP